MDKRTALPEKWKLQFPGLNCTVEKEIGRGSNAIVYQGWYEDASDVRQHHPVLIKELFPYEEAGRVWRDAETGGIQLHPEAAALMETHKESFRWGNEIHLKLKAKYPEETGGNINTYLHQGTCYTLLDFSGGRTLDRELLQSKEPADLRRIVLRGIGILDGLQAFHDTGFLHLDISPDNVILLNHGRRERVELIDYNSVVSISELKAGKTVSLSMKQGYAAPEIRKGDLLNIGPWTDLYSVAALFHFCLMGAPLTRMQLSGIAPVRVNSSRLLSEAPATVTAQIQKILVKGLAASGKRRYQTVEEMLQDFQELLDRIDGVGITHWSLWETCASSIRQEIGGNTGLGYLTEDASLYPLEIRDSAGERVPNLLGGYSNGVLTGSGGMGKTTLLLRTAWLESRCYQPDRSVVCYLSLQDYCPGDSSFIHDKILRRMRFHADTLTYDNARHTLDLLLQKPLLTRQGPRPVVILLLDGYNEISGDTQTLRGEIRELARMDGVSLLIASRNELPEYAFDTWSVEPLKEETVREVLGKYGLLIPVEAQIRELLYNPMMLTLFVSACRNQGEQVKVSDRESLIRTYLKTMVEKELRSLPEEAPEGWQVKAAVECVLPVIAGLSQGQPASNEQLVVNISRLYGLLNSRLLKKRFPQWPGHIGDIRGGAEQAEDWYRLMVQEILWRRLGLLVRDPEGQYRVFHQEFQESLAPQGLDLLAAVRRRKRAGLTAAALAVLTVLLCLPVFAKSSYDPEKAIEMMEMIQNLAMSADKLQEEMLDLLENEDLNQNRREGSSYLIKSEFAEARAKIERPFLLIYLDHVPDGAERGDGDLLPEYLAELEKLSETGEELPWNRLSVEENDLTEAVNWFHELQDRYVEYIDVLERAYAGGPEAYAHCCQLIRNVVEADTQACAVHYLITYEQRMEGILKWEKSIMGAEHYGNAGEMARNMELRPELLEMVRELKAREDEQDLRTQAVKHSWKYQELLAQDKIYTKYHIFNERNHK